MHPIRSFLTPPAIADENVACPAMGKEQEGEDRGPQASVDSAFLELRALRPLAKKVNSLVVESRSVCAQNEKLSTMFKILTHTFIHVYAVITFHFIQWQTSCIVYSKMLLQNV